MVTTAITSNQTDSVVGAFFEPFIGIAIGYQDIQASVSTAERCQRIVTLAAMMARSITALGESPDSNLAIATAADIKIADMRKKLGGNAITAAIAAVKSLWGGTSYTLSEPVLISLLKDYVISYQPIRS
jgi:hypothetical protein